jgi:hypothetical protein
MQFPLQFSKHENNGLLVKLKPIHHLNESQRPTNPKMNKFVCQVSSHSTMEKKDYIILVAAFVIAGFSLYRKYARKQKSGFSGKSGSTSGRGGGLRDQPDDYEPYSGKK